MKKKLHISFLFCAIFLSSQAQWILQSSGFPTPMRGIVDICAVDTNVVWAIANDGQPTSTTDIQEFTRTTNGGTKWKARSISGYNGAYLSMIHAIDSMTAWIPVCHPYPAGGGTIIKTTDGGVTWTPQTTAVFDGPSGYPNAVYFWNANEGYCMGDPNGGYFEIYTTSDGGTTWTRVPQSNIPPYLFGEGGISGNNCVMGDIIWFPTNKGRVYKSIDKGHHWTVSASPNTSHQMKLMFRDSNNGIAQLRDPPYTAYYTTNGGTTWQTIATSGNFYRFAFCYVPGTTSTYVSTGALFGFIGTSYSTNDGVAWNTITNTEQFMAVSFLDYRHGWAGGYSTDSTTGGMWKYNGNLFVFDSCAGLAAFFSKTADTLDLNTSGLVNFHDLSSGNHSTWHWDFGEGGSSSLPDPTHTYTSTGTFPVTLTVTNGTCTSSKTDTIVVKNTFGIERYGDGSAIEIWPNPAKDYLHIASAVPLTSVEIYNSLGQKAYVRNNQQTPMDINISDLLQGIYFIRITTAQGSSFGKFMITK
ncbi:MAG: T9SS type A sorting domain-containing protein [Bacteroidota bacterium]